MIRFLFKGISFLFFLSTLICGIIDTANSLALSKITMMSVRHFFEAISPGLVSKLPSDSAFHFNPSSFESYLMFLVDKPAWLVFLIFSILFNLLSKIRY